jgi:hypothetical protein
MNIFQKHRHGPQGADSNLAVAFIVASTECFTESSGTITICSEVVFTTSLFTEPLVVLVALRVFDLYSLARASPNTNPPPLPPFLAFHEKRHKIPNSNRT